MSFTFATAEQSSPQIEENTCTGKNGTTYRSSELYENGKVRLPKVAVSGIR
jgi:hypothetical protein